MGTVRFTIRLSQKLTGTVAADKFLDMTAGENGRCRSQAGCLLPFIGLDIGFFLLKIRIFQ
jgi:hypothetical protein